MISVLFLDVWHRSRQDMLRNKQGQKVFDALSTPLGLSDVAQVVISNYL